jgi:D-alanyl-D-alanine dipeptidase
MTLFRNLAFAAALALAMVAQERPPVFRIAPVRPVSELRAEALAARPPQEHGSFVRSDLVDLAKLDSRIRLDIRYATADNFLSTPVYTSARAFLQRPAAEALLRAHRELSKSGYGLLIFDAYRPWYVTRIFWDATPPDKHVFVANPAKGSRHNRGCAVDLSLYELATGREVPMPGGYDEMSDRSYANYAGGTAVQRANRRLLRLAMEKQGFTVYKKEWWHFDYRDWPRYAIGNIPFEEVP